MKAEMYAGALIAMTSRGATPKEAVRTLASYLNKRGMQSILQRLPAMLARRGLAQRLREETTIEVAHAHAAPHAKHEAQAYLAQLGIDPHAVRTKEDDSLIGGWRLVGKNTLVDNSFKKHLLTIYSQIIR